MDFCNPKANRQSRAKGGQCSLQESSHRRLQPRRAVLVPWASADASGCRALFRLEAEYPPLDTVLRPAAWEDQSSGVVRNHDGEFEMPILRAARSTAGVVHSISRGTDLGGVSYL